MIRDQIVEKCPSKTLRQRLLQQQKLDLKLARSEENARTQDSLLIASGTKEDSIPIDRVLTNQKEPPKTAYACYRCGGKDATARMSVEQSTPDAMAARTWASAESLSIQAERSRVQLQPEPATAQASKEAPKQSSQRKNLA